MQKPITCKHCNAQFVPMPGKPGLINECPVCVEERYAAPVVEERPANYGVVAKQRRRVSEATAWRKLGQAFDDLCKVLTPAQKRELDNRLFSAILRASGVSQKTREVVERLAK